MPAGKAWLNSSSEIRLGYVPLIDCAPIAVAHEKGIFKRHGLDVHLSRELGWASVRDKLMFGNLDAAHSIAGIALALGLGIHQVRYEVAVPMVLSLHGNAITLSNEIKPSDVGTGGQFSKFLAHSWKKDRPFTLAATHRFSSHYALLKTWLQRHGIQNSNEVEIVFLPPPLMPRHLKAGQIDGYCVGEPWNSESILSGIGWCPATSADIARGHPEKVLVVAGDFVNENREATIRLCTALLESCELCQSPDFREEMIQILAKREYTGASQDVLRNSLGEWFNSGISRSSAANFHSFFGNDMNRPSVEKASWVLSSLRNADTIPDGTCGSLSRIFREDLYLAAQQAIVS